MDCLVSSEIKAVATDKPTEFDGTRTVLYLRNGTLVNVVGRKVAGTDGQEASHLKQAGDTLDVRQIKAVIEYDGKLQNVSILHQGDRIVESAAALTRRMLRIGCPSTLFRVNIRRDRSRGQILHCLIQR